MQARIIEVGNLLAKTGKPGRKIGVRLLTECGLKFKITGLTEDQTRALPMRALCEFVELNDIIDVLKNGSVSE